MCIRDRFRLGRATNPLATSAAPTGFGSWRPIANAPIAPRIGGVATWNGEAAVFWAGRTGNGDEIVAVGSGAFYDPATDSWERARTPSFTHPGLAGIAAAGDEIFAAAKGSFLRVNLRDGSSTELPGPPVVVSFIVEVNGRLWAVGSERRPVDQAGPAFLSFAEFLPDVNDWSQAMHLKFLAPVSVASFGDGFVGCDAEGFCAFVNPTKVDDMTVQFLTAPTTNSQVTTTVVDDAIVALVLSSKDGRTGEIYRSDGEAWALVDSIPTGDFGDVTLAAAGDWLVVLSPDQPPVAMDIASGAWHHFDDWPMTGVRNPSTVWTGTQLIVWGGLESEGSEGAIWTPPAS